MTTLKDIFITLFIFYLVMSCYFMISALCSWSVGWYLDHHLLIKLSFSYCVDIVSKVQREYCKNYD